MQFIYSVATVLTVYGIETCDPTVNGSYELFVRLQQYLPFTVLKLMNSITSGAIWRVATVLTVYGIETPK